MENTQYIFLGKIIITARLILFLFPPFLSIIVVPFSYLLKYVLTHTAFLALH